MRNILGNEEACKLHPKKGEANAEDEKTWILFEMPFVAKSLGVGQHVLSIQDIAPVLLKKVFK